MLVVVVVVVGVVVVVVVVVVVGKVVNVVVVVVVVVVVAVVVVVVVVAVAVVGWSGAVLCVAGRIHPRFLLSRTERSKIRRAALFDMRLTITLGIDGAAARGVHRYDSPTLWNQRDGRVRICSTPPR